MWFVCSKSKDDTFNPLAVYDNLDSAIRALQTQFVYIPADSLYLFESLKDPLICHMVDKKLFIS